MTLHAYSFVQSRNKRNWPHYQLLPEGFQRTLQGPLALFLFSPFYKIKNILLVVSKVFLFISRFWYFEESMKTELSIKDQLYLKCQEHVEQRISNLQEMINTTQEAANDATKSSAGDKYETTRSMMHLENEQNAIQLNEALKLRKTLDMLSKVKKADMVQPGSLVYTSSGIYYIAVSIGKITLKKEDYFAISLASPLGQQLAQKKIGDSIDFNKKKIVIKDIL
jgi:transcription elongation GreA/GreB family factor